MKRSFSDAAADLFCGLVAYALSRWVWQGQGGIWENLPKELGTFLATFVVLRLLLGWAGRSWRRSREARRVAQVIRHQAPPPSAR